MTQYEWLTTILTITGIVLLPTLVLMFRAAMKWTRVEDQLNNVADDLKALIVDKDKTHAEMLQQMREDRNATNRRLRWLEENVWNKNK